jgi:hypothetical protein
MGRTSAGGNGNDSSESFGIARAVIGAKVMATWPEDDKSPRQVRGGYVLTIVDGAGCKSSYPSRERFASSTKKLPLVSGQGHERQNSR